MTASKRKKKGGAGGGKARVKKASSRAAAGADSGDAAQEPVEISAGEPAAPAELVLVGTEEDANPTGDCDRPSCCGSAGGFALCGVGMFDILMQGILQPLVFCYFLVHRLMCCWLEDFSVYPISVLALSLALVPSSPESSLPE